MDFVWKSVSNFKIMSSAPLLPSKDDVHFAAIALDIAKRAVSNGNHPFGAIFTVKDVDGTTRIICEAENTVHTDGDATCHAETNLLRQLAKEKLLTPANLDRGTLYTSTEPCMMCAAAMYWSGVSRVVFATSEMELSRHAGEDFLMPCTEVFARGTRSVVAVGPTHEVEGGALHASYWSK
eukprot:PhM_4_TR1618/c0_g2_i1/m.5183